MFARVTRISGAGQVSEDEGRAMTDQIMSEARQLEGIQGGYWMRSQESGDLYAVTLWESEESMTATEQQAASLREETSSRLGGGQITVDHCEVVAHF